MVETNLGTAIYFFSETILPISQRGASVNLTRPMTNAVVAQRFEVIFIILFAQGCQNIIQFHSIQ